MEALKILRNEQVREIAKQFDTPIYVYNEEKLIQTAKEVLNFPNAFGLTARFAMKANPNSTIIKLFTKLGLHIDASSEHEVERALKAGVPATNILLTAQELATNLKNLVEKGINFTATSFEQLEAYGQLFPGGNISIRINPGLGSGGTKRTNVGGPSSSFGIWHEKITQINEIVKKYSLKVIRIHTHIGSGSDPDIWQKVSTMSIQLLNHFPTAEILNLGGGFKVGRMSDEKSCNLQDVGKPIAIEFENFARQTGRKIRLEIEPGTYLVANSGAIISKIDAVCDTGSEGYKFYKINSGMTELIRPSMYGAQHPIVVITKDPSKQENANKNTNGTLVAGHCCESGDIFTPTPGDPEGLNPRLLASAQTGDFLVIEGAGAYGSGFSTINYNSFPDAAQVLLRTDGSYTLIRKRQLLEQIIQNEINVEM